MPIYKLCFSTQKMIYDFRPKMFCIFCKLCHFFPFCVHRNWSAGKGWTMDIVIEEWYTVTISLFYYSSEATEHIRTRHSCLSCRHKDFPSFIGTLISPNLRPKTNSNAKQSSIYCKSRRVAVGIILVITASSL